MDPLLVTIVLATTLAGILSITAAGILSFALLSSVVDSLGSVSVGIMLSTSLLHTLPEAFEAEARPHALFATLFGGLLTFFLIEKAVILRQSARQTIEGPSQHRHFREGANGRKAGWMILFGDGLHNFTDGIMIAAAYLANPSLGLVTGLALIAHEIPQEVGNFVVLLSASYSRARAYVYNLMCSLLGLAGGLLGYYTLDRTKYLVPYVLVFASAGFMYVILGDLMPKMQRRATLRESIPQIALLATGVTVAALAAIVQH